MNLVRKNTISPIPVLFLILWLPMYFWGQEFLAFPKPNLTEVGVKCSQLTLVKEISLDFDDELFFAVPQSLAVNKAGYLFVYDVKMASVFIFNNQYKCVGQCLKVGRGPGETPHPRNKLIATSRDGSLLICDGLGDKILEFSASSKLLREVKMNRIHQTAMPFPPVIDNQGFIYAYSLNNAIVEKKDKKMNTIASFLDINLNGNFVVYQPALPYSEDNKYASAKRKRFLSPNLFNTMYDVTEDGQLFIFLHRSVTAFLFKNDKLVRKFSIYIDRILPKYKKSLQDTMKKIKKNTSREVISLGKNMFHACFLDRDAPYFYLQLNDSQKPCFLYQFDMTGKLICIIQNFERPAFFQAKRNGLFYGLSIDDNNPVIFKVKEVGNL